MRKYVSEMFTAAILPKLGSSLHVRPNLVILWVIFTIIILKF